MTLPPPTLSLVVPMYNEEEGAAHFFERTEAVLARLGETYEIVCVNDGSRDRTLEILVQHHQRNPAIKVVDLSRNFGKDIALTAGLDHTCGRAVIPMDADCQDPPEVIEKLLEKWRAGADVVTARRGSRESDTKMKRLTAGWFYKLFNSVAQVPIPPDTGDFRLMDRRVVEALKLLQERNRFMKGLFAWVGYRQAEVVYIREERALGTTKWNYWKLWNFALDGIVAFSSAPLRIWGYLGVLVSLLSLLYGSFLVIRTLVFGIDQPGYASLMVAVLFLGGLQLISLGVIGEYLSRMYNETKHRPLYLVRDFWK